MDARRVWKNVSPPYKITFEMAGRRETKTRRAGRSKPARFQAEAGSWNRCCLAKGLGSLLGFKVCSKASLSRKASLTLTLNEYSLWNAKNIKPYSTMINQEHPSKINSKCSEKCLGRFWNRQMLMTRSCSWSCYKTSKAFVAHLISIVLDFCRGFSSRTMVRSKGCGPVIGKRSKVGKFPEVRRHSSSRESGESAEKALFVWVLCLSYRILWRGGVFLMMVMLSKVGVLLTISGLRQATRHVRAGGDAQRTFLGYEDSSHLGTILEMWWKYAETAST